MTGGIAVDLESDRPANRGGVQPTGPVAFRMRKDQPALEIHELFKVKLDFQVVAVGVSAGVVVGGQAPVEVAVEDLVGRALVVDFRTRQHRCDLLARAGHTKHVAVK